MPSRLGLDRVTSAALRSDREGGEGGRRHFRQVVASSGGPASSSVVGLGALPEQGVKRGVLGREGTMCGCQGLGQSVGCRDRLGRGHIANSALDFLKRHDHRDPSGRSGQPQGQLQDNLLRPAVGVLALLRISGRRRSTYDYVSK